MSWLSRLTGGSGKPERRAEGSDINWRDSAVPSDPAAAAKKRFCQELQEKLRGMLPKEMAEKITVMKYQPEEGIVTIAADRSFSRQHLIDIGFTQEPDKEATIPTTGDFIKYGVGNGFAVAFEVKAEAMERVLGIPQPELPKQDKGR